MAESGKPMPLDFEPVKDGVLLLAEPRYPGGAIRAAHVPDSQRDRWAGSLYRSHLATCPDARERRK